MPTSKNTIRLVKNSPEYQQLIRQRWDGLEERIQLKLDTIAVRDRSGEKRLLQQALQASTASKRVLWLRKAADLGVEEAVKLSACRKGCSHCCHISVVVSKSEASVIAKETGARLNPQAGAIVASDEDRSMEETIDQFKSQFHGVACPFLEGGSCSIYAHRPLACRLQVNMDDDDLLCRLVDGGEMPRVPYLNMQAHTFYALSVWGPHQQYDDIRAWFAPGPTIPNKIETGLVHESAGA